MSSPVLFLAQRSRSRRPLTAFLAILLGVGTGLTGTTVATAQTDQTAETAKAAGNAETVEAASTVSFRDAVDHTHQPAIEALVSDGIILGCATDRFCPDVEVTRGQLATILVNSLDLPDGDAPAFRDVDADHAHARSIGAVVDAGIFQGIDEGRFAPSATTSRAQLATVIDHAFALSRASSVGEVPEFRDIDSTVHASSVRSLAEAGVARGCSTDRFCPSADVSRGQTATLLAVASGRLDPADVPAPAPEPVPAPASAPAPAAPGKRQIAHGTELRREDTGVASSWSGSSSGAVVSSHDGQVIENLDISVSGGAAITVEHQNVTVRNNRIRHDGGANGVMVASGVTGAVVEFNEIDGRRGVVGNQGSIGVYAAGQAEVRRNFITDGRLGVNFRRGNSSAIENWVENLVVANGSHGNGFSFHGHSSESGVQFLRNRTPASNSAGITFYASYGPVRDAEIRENLIIGSERGFAIYGGRTHDHYASNSDVRIEGNRFEGSFQWPTAVGDGTNAGTDLGRPGNTYANNRWVGSSEDLSARCGISQNACE